MVFIFLSELFKAQLYLPLRGLLVLIFLSELFLVQLFLPPTATMNRDFIRKVLKGDK